MDILKDNIVTAKKQHKCNYCYSVINQGDKYRNTFIVNSGDSYEFKSHISCDKLVEKLNLYKDCVDEGVTDDLFQEVVVDRYKEINNFIGSYRDLPKFDEMLSVVKQSYNIL